MDWYTPKYLKPHELVDKATYNKAKSMGKLHYIYWQFNPLVLITADMLRERFGAVTVNNWYTGGSFQERGLRSSSTSTGATFSAHKVGAALDCNFKDASAAEVRRVMRELGCFKPGFRDNITKESECFKHIGRIENTQNGKQISWFHFDICNCYNADGSIVSLDI